MPQGFPKIAFNSWEKPRHQTMRVCWICGIGPAGRLTVQVSWFRSDDVMINCCQRCKGLPNIVEEAISAHDEHRFNVMRIQLNALRKQEIKAGAKEFMGIPDDWYDEPRFRCPNEHVHGGVIKTEVKGDMCTCGQNVMLSFPGDKAGPLHWRLEKRRRQFKNQRGEKERRPTP